MVFHDRMPISNYISSYIAVRKTKRWLLFCSYILSLSKSSNSKGISLSYFFIPLSAKYITISPISFKPIQWVFQVSPSSQTRNNFIGNNTNEILWNFSLKRRIGGEIAKTQHNWWLNPQLDPIKPVKWPAITVKMWPCSVQRITRALREFIIPLKKGQTPSPSNPPSHLFLPSSSFSCKLSFLFIREKERVLPCLIASCIWVYSRPVHPLSTLPSHFSHPPSPFRPFPMCYQNLAGIF